VHSINKHLEAFTFGTRLSRITHYLRKKDANDALELINESVKDWSGGTKIGETLVITPKKKNHWDTLFETLEQVDTSDFMNERVQPPLDKREDLF